MFWVPRRNSWIRAPWGRNLKASDAFFAEDILARVVWKGLEGLM